ncbi:MAG: NYN domain-containing protein [Chloroflexi bacterium]|nr:NYN domain-containing protein [Chloroflexota bacterium]
MQFDDQPHVALFIDFENIRYSLLNRYNQEPDPQVMIAKARKYGLVPVASAYADFSRQPEFFPRKLQAANIRRVDAPTKIRADGREQSTADLYMLMDVVETLLDRPQIRTFVLMTGDSDFVRISARLKHGHDKTVVISGVPGTTSRDLVASASIDDPIEVTPASEDLTPADVQLIRFLDWAEGHWDGVNMRGVINYLTGPKQPLGPLDPDYTKSILTAYGKRGIVLFEDVPVEGGFPRRNIRLNREHTWVQHVVQESPQARAEA